MGKKQIPLQVAVSSDGATLTATIPEGTPTGDYELYVTSGGQELKLDGTVTIDGGAPGTIHTPAPPHSPSGLFEKISDLLGGEELHTVVVARIRDVLILHGWKDPGLATATKEFNGRTDLRQATERERLMAVPDILDKAQKTTGGQPAHT